MALSPGLQVNAWPGGRGLVRPRHRATARSPAASLATRQPLWNRVILEGDRWPALEATAQRCLQRTAEPAEGRKATAPNLWPGEASLGKKGGHISTGSIAGLCFQSRPQATMVLLLLTLGLSFGGTPNMPISYKLASSGRRFLTISADVGWITISLIRNLCLPALDQESCSL